MRRTREKQHTDRTFAALAAFHLALAGKQRKTAAAMPPHLRPGMINSARAAIRRARFYRTHSANPLP